MRRISSSVGMRCPPRRGQGNLRPRLRRRDGRLLHGRPPGYVAGGGPVGAARTRRGDRLVRVSEPRGRMDFRILGPLEVWDGDRELAVNGSKQRALLALLLLDANQVVSSERLVEELWAPSRRKAAERLSGCASRSFARRCPPTSSRRALPGTSFGRPGSARPPPLRAVCRGGASRPRRGSTWSCGSAAARGRRPLRGPALADVVGEDFAVIACTRLEELRLAAVELRVEAELALGRHAELVSELRAPLAEHPLRERLRGQLMVALYELSPGRGARGLSAGAGGPRRRARDQPGPALRDLNTAILNQDPALDARAPRPPSHPRPSPPILVCVQDEERLDGLIGLAGTLAPPSRERGDPRQAPRRRRGAGRRPPA